ncbi:phage tail assembly chaperone [Novosphingobium bradum]|uniref:Phage tail assembly chaperone n=1 Tax=Novosphingobium bradum TaxID=1737444 RepID=A0ABV7IUI9_9SPHN
MSETFAATAGQLAGLAGRFLGWRPDEFWNATPAELAAILLPVSGPGAAPLGRSDLARMMEHDND